MMGKEMRILHINCNYMGTRLHQTMIEHLDSYVLENKVFCPIYNGSDIVTKPNSNVIVSNCFSWSDRAFYFRKQRKIIQSVEEKIKVNDYNCIHAYTLFTDGNVAYQLSKKYSIPYVVAIRSTDVEFFKYRPYLKSRGIEIMKNASAVFFLADTMRQHIISQYLSSKDAQEVLSKSYVIPNGIDDFWFENKYRERTNYNVEKQIKERVIKIICVAQIIKRKNIPMLQEAILLLKNQGWDVSLKVIGKPVNQKEYKKIIADPNTEFIRPVPKEKLIDYYRQADIFVLPSKRETFGLVYAEAMSQGLPVVYSRGEGFDEQFEEGEVGFSVSNTNKKELAEKIILCVTNYRKLSEKAVEYVDKFNWNSICEKYRDIYDDIIRRGNVNE